MPTLVFLNAKIFLAGHEFSGDFNQLTLAYEAESLDGTTFGIESRRRVGGLKTSRVTGAGFWQAGLGNKPDPIMFDLVGSTDDVVMVFPDGITEGATSTGSGYMFKTFTSRYGFGGQVGDLLPFTIEAEGRGVHEGVIV